jgi:hypothetical protein
MWIPSLIATLVFLSVAFIWRRTSGTYAIAWWIAVTICSLVAAGYFIWVFTIPFYSQSTEALNSSGDFGIIPPPPLLLVVFAFVFFIVMPSLPTLFGLAFLPPRNLLHRWQRALPVLIGLYAVILAALIYNRHTLYWRDYERQKLEITERESERWEDYRNLPLSTEQLEQRKRLNAIIERDNEREQPP